MNKSVDKPVFIAVVDDDLHSAHLLRRMLVAHGSPDIDHWGDASEAAGRLQASLEGPRSWRPSMIIVDLKVHSGASQEFIVTIALRCRAAGIPIAVMVPSADRATCDRLHDAGASGVFQREADLAAYRREAAGIVSFWVRTQRLDAVGT